MEATEEHIGGMTQQELRGTIEKRIDERPANQISGLVDLIAALIPPGTVRLSVASTPAPNELVADGSSQSKSAYPGLNAKLEAEGYPWGSTPAEFTLPPLVGTEPDPDLTWMVRT